MKRNEVQVKFLEAINAFPGIQLMDLRYMIDRTASIEADRFVLESLHRREYITSVGESIYNKTYTCTETGIDFLASNLDLLQPTKKVEVDLDEDETHVPGTCQTCGKPTKDLIRFRKKDICGDCLNGDWVPSIIPVYLSSFVIAD